MRRDPAEFRVGVESLNDHTEEKKSSRNSEDSYISDISYIMKDSSVQSSASLRAESVQDMDEAEAVMISDSDSLGDEEDES